MIDARRGNAWHTGALEGSSTLLVRRFDGLNWAVLFNARREKLQEHPGRVIDPLLHKAVDSITEWPERDLFQSYLRRKTSVAVNRQVLPVLLKP